MKMDLIESSETSAIINQTPGNYPKENLLHLFSFPRQTWLQERGSVLFHTYVTCLILYHVSYFIVFAI